MGKRAEEDRTGATSAGDRCAVGVPAIQDHVRCVVKVAPGQEATDLETGVPMV